MRFKDFKRTPVPFVDSIKVKLILPKLKCIDDLKEYTVNDIKLENYDHHPAIKAKMAI